MGGRILNFISILLIMVILIVLSSVGPSESTSLPPIAASLHPPRTIRTPILPNATTYCAQFGITSISVQAGTSLTEEEKNLMIAAYTSCTTGISQHFRQVTENDNSIIKFTNICIIARIVVDKCSAMINLLRIQGSYHMESAAALLVLLNNNRFFVANMNYNQINLKSDLFISSPNSEYHSLDIHSCFNEFSSQVESVNSIIIDRYKENYRSRRTRIAKRIQRDGCLVCSCFESIYYHRYFVHVFRGDAQQLAAIHDELCFNDDYKMVHWPKKILVKILQSLEQNVYSRNKALLIKFLRYGWKMALSKWGEIDNDWDFMFVLQHLPDNVEDLIEATTAMALAIDNNLSTENYSTLVTIIQRFSAVDGLEYNEGECAKSILSVFFELNRGIQNTRKTEFWRAFDKTALLNYLDHLTNLAVSEGMKSVDFIRQLALLENIVYQRQWDTVALNSLFRTSEALSISNTVNCIRLMAEFEQMMLIPAMLDHTISKEMYRTEDNYMTILSMNLPCNKLREHLFYNNKGPTLLYQSILTGPASFKPYMNTITPPTAVAVP